jgi:hypothetical protein
MIDLVFSLLVMIIIAWYFATNNRWKDISWEIRNGLKCLSCKEDIYTLEEETELWMSGKLPLKKGVNNITTCKSCKRDESIDILFGKKSNLLIKLRNYLISDGSGKLIFILTAVLLSVTVINFICILLGIKGFGVVLNSINILYWIIMFIIKRKYLSIKNPSQ